MIFKKESIPTSHFLISAPRSGTTWLSRILNTHPDIFCVERRLFGNHADMVIDEGIVEPRLRVTLDNYVQSLLLHHGFPSNFKNELIKGFVKELVNQEKSQSGKKIIVDKITPYLDTSQKVIESINNYFPKSKIIYLIRDGRDVLTSGVFHWFNKVMAGDELNQFEIKRKELVSQERYGELERFFQKKEIEKWANEWKQPLQTLKQASKNHKVLIVKYEDLLTDPNAMIKNCFKFLNLKSKDSIIKNCVSNASFEKMSQGRKTGAAIQTAHIRKGISGDWQNYFTREDAELFQNIAGDMLVEFGYEENENWVNGIG